MNFQYPHFKTGQYAEMIRDSYNHGDAIRHSVGFLLGEDKDKYVVSLEYDEGDHHQEVSVFMKKMVLMIKRLK
jgi:hypothetical protein